MSELSPEEQKGIIIVVFFVIGVTILISQKLFPIFLIGTGVFLILLIIAVVIDFCFRDPDSLDTWDYFSTYAGIGLVIFLLCTGITYFIGYGLGGTSFGQASVQVYTSITGVEKTIDDATEQTINTLVETNCQILSEEDCANLRHTAKTVKTVQEISALVDKLKMAEEVAETLTK